MRVPRAGNHYQNNVLQPLAIQTYMSREKIQQTVRYTELLPTRFKDFWRQ
jgi:hypothetical protein